MNVSIIIPAYNEAGAISRVLFDVKTEMNRHPENVFEIIVVDDGSSDETGTEAKALGARVFSNPTNMGYGFSLMRGIENAVNENIVIMDADGTYPAEKIPLLVEGLEKGFDMVVGQRSGKAYWSSPMKSFFRIVFKFMAEYVVGRRIPDINSGFRAFRKNKVLPILPQLSKGFSFTTSVTLIFFLKGYFIGYVPVPYAKREGKTKVKHFHDSLKALQIMADIIVSYNPIKLFLLLATLSLMCALILLVASFSLNQWTLFSLAVQAFFLSLLIMAFGFFADIFRIK